MIVSRTWLLLAWLALPVGFAQQLYLGASLGTPLTGEANSLAESFELGAQLGLDLPPGLGARVALEGNPLNGGLKLASGTAIFRLYLPLSSSSLYTGLGADAYFSTQPASVSDLRNAVFVAHALGGLEVRLGRWGLFGGLLPSYLIGQDFSARSSYYLRARGGVNFHF